MFGGEPLDNHFCKTFVKISAIRKQAIQFFTLTIVSQWQTEVAIATKVLEQR